MEVLCLGFLRVLEVLKDREQWRRRVGPVLPRGWEHGPDPPVLLARGVSVLGANWQEDLTGFPLESSQSRETRVPLCASWVPVSHGL